ncbi:MAG: cell division protein FtsQ/DivIB [Pseudomonadota bacterium]
MRSLIPVFGRRHSYERAARKTLKRAPRDPAPSKWHYRWQRWMLTPGVRAGLRIGTPLLLIAVIVGAWIAKPDNRAMVTNKVAEVTEAIQHRPEFIVSSLSIIGADEQTEADVQTMLPLSFPVSSFDLDLEEMRATVEDLYAVKNASVRVGDGGTLEVDIVPRVPVAVWRDQGTLRLIDADKVMSGIIESRAARRDLPLIAGEGAHAHLDEALTLFRTAHPIKDQVRALVRMGERRWDVVLDRNIRLMLPEENPVAALDRIIVINDAKDMLSRDIAAVDMRNPARPVLRMSPDAANALRRVNSRGDN